MAYRDYPPASQVHRPDCPGIIPGVLPELPTPQIARQFPNAVMHNCYHFHRNRTGVVEPVVYPDHKYEPSTSQPRDARVALCATCRGTHGGEPVDDGLLLPDRNPRILLPGESPGARPGIILPGDR